MLSLEGGGEGEERMESGGREGEKGMEGEGEGEERMEGWGEVMKKKLVFDIKMQRLKQHCSILRICS